jgi:hypothetical protein
MFAPEGHSPGKVTVYDAVDLLAACCRDYGSLEGSKNRRFSLPRELLLFAVLTHVMGRTADFPRRIRIVRNLIFASQDEIRLENMRELLDDTFNLVHRGQVDAVKRYNTRQVKEEQSKAAFLADHPGLQEVLQRLEDHWLLRGCLGAFDLDPANLPSRAIAFREAFNEADGEASPEAKAALLACGDYSKPKSSGRYHQFGCGRADAWRDLFSRDPNPRTQAALREMLDAVRDGTGPIEERLGKFTTAWLDAQEKARTFDWRYYLVKYPEMGSGTSGLYVPNHRQMGFELCMLNKTTLNSNYRDPYLLAVWERSSATEKDVETLWFKGYETDQRWLRLARTGVALMCTSEGFLFREPSNHEYARAFEAILAKHGADGTRLRIPQVENGGETFDQVDRVLIGAVLVRDLLAMRAALRDSAD